MKNNIDILIMFETYGVNMGGDFTHLLDIVNIAKSNYSMVIIVNSDKLYNAIRSKYPGIKIRIVKTYNSKFFGGTGIKLVDKFLLRFYIVRDFITLINKLACISLNFLKYLLILRKYNPSVVHINNGGYPGSDANSALVLASFIANTKKSAYDYT